MGVFLVTAIGAALVAALGFWAAQNAAQKAKREREDAQNAERLLGRFRTLDHAAPPRGEEPNKPSDSGIRDALAGTSGSSQQSQR